MLVQAQGVRLLDLSCLMEALQPLASCRFCIAGRLELKEDTSKADRLYSGLLLSCEGCSYQLHVHTSRPVQDETSSTEWEVNRCTERIKVDLNVDEDLLFKVLQGYGVPYTLPEPSANPSQEVGNQPEVQDAFEEGDAGVVADVQDDVGLLTEAFPPEEEAELLKFPNTEEKSASEPKASSSSSRSKNYTCLICHREFRRLGALKLHSSEHSDKDTFSCPVCMETFQAEDKLKIHLKMHSRSNLQCSVCGKNFKKTFNFTQHIRTHTGEKPFLCPTCGKSFGDSSTLSKHQKSVHSSERPLRCDACGKAFYHAGHLKVHMRRHTGEKPYPCEICGKSFAYPDSIKKHMLTHSDQRHFQCNTCGRTFRWRESLKQHLKTHQQQQQKTQNAGSEQWQHQASDVQGNNEPVHAPVPTEVPVSVAATDVVSLTQVIPYLETIRVEYY